jgi:hypothetical protein
MHQACIAEGTEILKYVLTTPLFTAPSFVPDNDKGESALHYACRIGLWHEIQNRLKNTWFDVVFHADSDSIFF